KWSPGLKILTYYGSQKERKLKRVGWTKTNAFHVCITSYKLVIQDHAIFRRKKWKYFILDEAQNIKNFKSQRWQTLLNFQSQRRLLLTGTPLQNNLMELWSLMHFLMPHVFASHRQFNHWFNNPFKTMIEKSTEVNEQLIKRLHKVLRPFILRRLKAHVEKQMPKKYEHVIKCALSKRQRLLYDEFMSLSSTREKIAQGHYMSVINILMQLRKVCNHPDLFEPRPIVSSFVSQPLEYRVPSIVFNLGDELAADRFCHYHPGLADMETMSAFDSHRAKRLQVTGQHIEQCLCQEQPKSRDHVTRGNFFQDKTLVGIRSSSSILNVSAELTDHSIKASYLARLNKLRFIFHKPVYGRDLIDCVSGLRASPCDNKWSFATRSYATCEMSRASRDYLEYTDTLRHGLNLVRDYLMREMESVCEKFVMYVPNVRYSSSDYVTLRIANPYAGLYCKYTNIKRPITNVCVRTGLARLSQIVNGLTSTQFPDKRLIQYDCGKLQKLDSLLRQLYSGEHRVLLFTQMTRMLDVLENFLNYHGYKYLRLDGATSIEQRQVLMERFNTDSRIFCFILSTRSGGVGVNLTGADTVVFYDSDWNPTMDAQAQDRCHRIGQTRDVHIYRLISEKTVEENILKKADQKRLLSQMAIEGGCFTTAVLRQSHITELFEERDEPVSQENSESYVGQMDDAKFEEALGMVEDESDVNAAKNLRQEVQADIAEFDENDNLMTDDPDMTKLHTEFKFIETELKPIERYALKYLESTGEVQIENDAEPDIEQVKKNWELERLKQLKEEEERRAEQEEEDLMYTYTKTEVRKSARPAKSRPVSCEKKQKFDDPKPTTKKEKKEKLVKEKDLKETKALSPVRDEITEAKKPCKRGRKPKSRSIESPPPVQEPCCAKPIPTEKPKVLTLCPSVQSAPKPVLKTIITRPSVPIKSIFNIPTTLNRTQSNQPIILKTNNVINVPATSPNKLIFRTVPNVLAQKKPASVLSSTCLSPSPSSSNSSSQSK
ncbi:PHOTOPERIOD-INDEPENDENT EARLY FLOWERING 1-like isoform X1, partial [Brachionus plicatilis]